ncbi:hypothetical protein AB0N17_03390 [Streptomyces sp. NPDC051133]|uniref:hypothetical protein n=1 Tax=Streptomyces sp. NPDC051133 TaxID=3155521 RepID=UPI00341BC346
MNTRRVNAAADVICRAMENGRRVPAAMAVALESAQMLMSPEKAAEYERLQARVDEVERKYTFDTAELKRQLESARVDGERLIRAEQRRAELEAVHATHRKDDQSEIERLRAQVAELERRIAAEECRCPEPAPLCQGCRCKCHAEQVTASVDKLTRLLAPTQAPREGEAAPLVVFRASHDAIVMGHYTSAAEARKHCETEMRREYDESTKVSLWWREDEDTVDQPEDGEAELYAHVTPSGMDRGRTWRTGYVMTPVEVASEYDPDGDE